METLPAYVPDPFLKNRSPSLGRRYFLSHILKDLQKYFLHPDSFTRSQASAITFPISSCLAARTAVRFFHICSGSCPLFIAFHLCPGLFFSAARILSAFSPASLEDLCGFFSASLIVTAAEASASSRIWLTIFSNPVMLCPPDKSNLNSADCKNGDQKSQNRICLNHLQGKSMALPNCSGFLATIPMEATEVFP